MNSMNNKKANKLFAMLAEKASDVNFETLKQISVYIAKTTGDKLNFDLKCRNYKIEDNIYNYVLSLDDGRKIFFSSVLTCLDFIVMRFDLENRLLMSTNVFLRDVNDLSTINVYGSIKEFENGIYIVTFRPDNINDERLKYGSISYYSEDEVNWLYELVDEDIVCDFDIVAKNNSVYPFAEKSYFDLYLEDDYEIDSLGGYVSNVVSRIDLLYDNIINVKNNKLVKVKSK